MICVLVILNVRLLLGDILKDIASFIKLVAINKTMMELDAGDPQTGIQLNYQTCVQFQVMFILEGSSQRKIKEKN